MSEFAAWIAGVSVLGPGLAGWEASRAILAGETPWQEAPFAPPAPSLLPATERRRTSPAVRLAIAAAAGAVAMSGMPPEELPSVFASSNGDGTVVGAILDALQEPAVAISPTQFHNSVHNAAAGYWAIAVGSNRSSVSLGGHDRVFATALLQALAAVAATRAPLLLCAYDVPLPPPLAAKRRTDISFATGLVLTPAPTTTSIAALRGRFVAEPATPEDPVGDLAALQAMNPVARALPLLLALAARRAAALSWALESDARLDLAVTPC